jgi:hypothetical protein
LNLNSSQPGKGLEVAPAAAVVAAVAAAVAVAAVAAAVAVAAVVVAVVTAVVVASIDFGKARGIAGPGCMVDMVVILRGGTGGRLALSMLWGIPDTVTGALTAIIWTRTRPASSAQVAN